MSLIHSKDIIHVENIITILIIETVIPRTLARFSKTPPRIPRRLICKLFITQAICRRQMHGQRSKRLLTVNTHSRKNSFERGGGHTETNPPSGFARRNFGWELTIGFKSLRLVMIRNFAGGGCECGLEYTMSDIIEPGSRFMVAKLMLCRGEKLVGEMLRLGATPLPATGAVAGGKCAD